MPHNLTDQTPLLPGTRVYRIAGNGDIDAKTVAAAYRSESGAVGFVDESGTCYAALGFYGTPDQAASDSVACALAEMRELAQRRSAVAGHASRVAASLRRFADAEAAEAQLKF